MFAEPVLGRAVMGERSHEGTICAAPPRHVPEMQSCVIGCRKITSLAVRSDALCVLVSFGERIEQCDSRRDIALGWCRKYHPEGSRITKELERPFASCGRESRRCNRPTSNVEPLLARHAMLESEYVWQHLLWRPRMCDLIAGLQPPNTWGRVASERGRPHVRTRGKGSG